MNTTINKKLKSNCNGCIHKILHRDYDKMVVSMWDHDEVPKFRQGAPRHELEESVTADLCEFWIGELQRLKTAANVAHGQERVPFGFYYLSHFGEDGEYTKNELVLAVDGKLPDYINTQRVISPLYKD